MKNSALSLLLALMPAAGFLLGQLSASIASINVTILVAATLIVLQLEAMAKDKTQ